MARNPREDPQPGDIIRRQGKRNNFLTRSVTARRYEQVWYRSGDLGKIREIFLINWIEWARDAEIITQLEIKHEHSPRACQARAHL